MKLTRPANKDYSNPWAPGPKPVRHSGLDFGHGAGTQVRAAAPGEVVSVYGGGGTNGGWGNRIIIEHAPGVFTAYAHLRTGSLTVKKGDRVSAGQLIGQMGNTGTKDVHLHFEVMIGGSGPSNRVDPAPYFGTDLPGTGAPAAIANTQRTVRRDLRTPIMGRLGASTASEVRQQLAPGAVGSFDGFIRGERVDQNGHNTEVWFRGAFNGNYFWAGNFQETIDGLGVAGLADLGTFAGAAPAAAKHQYFTAPAGGQYYFLSQADALAARGYTSARMVPAGVKRHVVENPGKGAVRISLNGTTVWVGTKNHPARVSVESWDPSAA
jgi:hypothetical protein